MKVPVIRIPTLLCQRCTHTWEPRQMHVSICPRCKSKLWNVPPRTAQERRHYREAQRRRLTKKGGA
jgi:predicted Zn-ribbon and HTH transcriptional regulator